LRGDIVDKISIARLNGMGDKTIFRITIENEVYETLYEGIMTGDDFSNVISGKGNCSIRRETPKITRSQT
jgi:hypothetical protein